MKINIAIVGAGIAGLSAAEKLSKNNKFKVVVFEEEAGIGGRTKVEEYRGVTIDYSAQFLFSNFETIMKSLNENKMNDKKHIIKKSLFSFYKNKKMHPFTVVGLFKYTSTKEKRELLTLAKKLRENSQLLKFTNVRTNEELDSDSFTNWLQKIGCENLVEYIAQPVTSALSLTHPEKISAAYGLALVNATLTKKIMSLSGGIGEICKKMHGNILKNGSTVITNEKVKRISIDGDKIAGLETNNGFFDIDIIINTTPLPRIKEIANKQIKDITGKVKYSPAIQTWILTESEQIKKMALMMPRIEWEDNMALLETSIKSEHHLPAGKSMVEVFAYEEYARKLMNKDDKYIAEKIIENLKEVVGIKKDTVEWIKVNKIKNAIPIHCKKYCETAEKINNFREVTGLYFAGDFAAMPCTETAAWSGNITAEKIEKEYI
ncbi:MAG: FAD-dependent oxidoreductase [Candidatus Omnitrophota bacterium]